MRPPDSDEDHHHAIGVVNRQVRRRGQRKAVEALGDKRHDQPPPRDRSSQPHGRAGRHLGLQLEVNIADS
jgi:hypothetical protein